MRDLHVDVLLFALGAIIAAILAGGRRVAAVPLSEALPHWGAGVVVATLGPLLFHAGATLESPATQWMAKVAMAASFAIFTLALLRATGRGGNKLLIAAAVLPVSVVAALSLGIVIAEPGAPMRSGLLSLVIAGYCSAILLLIHADRHRGSGWTLLALGACFACAGLIHLVRGSLLVGQFEPAVGPIESDLVRAATLLIVAGAVAFALTASNRAQDVIEANAAALAARTDEALRLARAKSSFLASMSHEIRTPLAAIIGHAERASAARADSVQVAESIAHVRAGANHLLSIVNDILDAAQLEGGNIVLACEPMRPLSILANAAAMFETTAEAKSVRVRVVDGGSLPEQVLGDALRVRQVVMNLLSNAIKFTPPGGLVTVALDRVDDDLRINVIDSGIGIDAARIDRLFQPFSQIDEGAARRHRGTGLGLHICARLVDAMRGHITVTSQLAVGSTFSVRLPLMLPDVAVAEPIAAGAPTAARTLDRARILLAEDDAVLRDLVATMLRELEADVHVVGDGYELIAAAAAVRYDCLVVDMHMPGLDGAEAVSRLRQTGYAGPVLALTADVMPESRQHQLAAGCDQVLAKPVDRDTLAHTLATLLGKTRGSLATSARPDSQSRIRARFAATVPGEIVGLRDALKNGDRKGLADRAHRLRGTGGFLGLDALRERMECLERHANLGCDAELALAVEDAIEAFGALHAAAPVESRVAIEPTSETRH